LFFFGDTFSFVVLEELLREALLGGKSADEELAGEELGEKKLAGAKLTLLNCCLIILLLILKFSKLTSYP
jgi:hypothetical protein